MVAAPVLRQVFRAYREHWGQEDTSIVFERPGERIEVFVYRARTALDCSYFATIGPSERPLPQSDEHIEFYLARRGPLSHECEHAIAAQMANLASHPWLVGTSFDWGHLIGLPGGMPSFEGTSAVFLSWTIEPDGLVTIPSICGGVKFLQVIPITAAERARAADLTNAVFLEELLSSVDVRVGRPPERSPSSAP